MLVIYVYAYILICIYVRTYYNRLKTNKYAVKTIDSDGNRSY